MDLSVVVPTLNARDRLEATLDALEAHASDVEVIVVNGPSADGTSGMVREHDTPDLLLELSERNLNAARNAGIAAADGEVIALIGQDSRIEEGWVEATRRSIEEGAAAVTGPIHREVNGGVTTESVERRTIGSREVTYFDGGNVALTADALDALDGFDEYLHTGAARDAAHRLAGMERSVAWEPDASVLRNQEDDIFHRVGADDESTVIGLKYRSLAYRLAKNYGLRLGVIYRLAQHAVVEGGSSVWEALRGNLSLSQWVSSGRAVFTNTVMGVQDGLAARVADRSPRRNPNGVSSRMNRPVARYEL
ncbi:MAG: glycosyltransferase family 2 protein [Halodesulfurarchaeum sp.]